MVLRSDVSTDTLVGSDNQTSSGDCVNDSPTWPGVHHPVGQAWVDSKRNRLWSSDLTFRPTLWLDLTIRLPAEIASTIRRLGREFIIQWGRFGWTAKGIGYGPPI